MWRYANERKTRAFRQFHDFRQRYRVKLRCLLQLLHYTTLGLCILIWSWLYLRSLGTSCVLCHYVLLHLLFAIFPRICVAYVHVFACPSPPLPQHTTPDPKHHHTEPWRQACTKTQPSASNRECPLANLLYPSGSAPHPPSRLWGSFLVRPSLPPHSGRCCTRRQPHTSTALYQGPFI